MAALVYVVQVLQQKVSECTASLRTADEKLASCETSLKSGKSHRDKPAAVDVPEDKHEVPESKKVQKEAHKSGPAAASNANETSGSEVHINGTEDLIEQDKVNTRLISAFRSCGTATLGVRIETLGSPISMWCVTFP